MQQALHNALVGLAKTMFLEHLNQGVSAIFLLKHGKKYRYDRGHRGQQVNG
jgi:hypothetical protein